VGHPPAYDANGDMLSDCSYNPPAAYVWNVYGDPTSLKGVNVTYDAFDREAEISGTTQILYSPIGKLGTMNGQSANTIRIPLPGGSIAEVLGPSGSTEHILHADWLGSARLSTTYPGTLAYDTAYGPYGEAYVPSGTSSGDLNFTGQSQDTLSGTYDFLYREYNPVQGRWISPDPAGLNAADPTNPQSWNRYAYVANNPLSSTDVGGLGSRATCAGLPGAWGPLDPCAVAGDTVGGDDSGCIVDGAPTPCNMISWNSGAFVMCPTNDCGPQVSSNGFIYRLMLDQEGWHYLNPLNGESFEDGSEIGLPALPTLGDSGSGANNGPGAGTAGCIAKGLQSAFPGSTVSTGTPAGEVGGHWNFNVTLQFPSQFGFNQFNSLYSASGGWPPPARFGPGPALHLENLGDFGDGSFGVVGTAHIDLFNPDTGLGGIAGHLSVDGAWGHIVQLFGGNIDPKRCPF
jgi:RHS repeat-associated protein